MNEKLPLNDIPILPGVSENNGKYQIELDPSGLSRRVALATLYDEVHRLVDGPSDSENVSTDSQKDWLAKFGYEAPQSQRVAQALIDDICEQLDRDVIKAEKLDEGVEVVHVKDKLKVSSIKCLNSPSSGQVTRPGISVFCTNASEIPRRRKLQRHRNP